MKLITHVLVVLLSIMGSIGCARDVARHEVIDVDVVTIHAVIHMSSSAKNMAFITASIARAAELLSPGGIEGVMHVDTVDDQIALADVDEIRHNWNTTHDTRRESVIHVFILDVDPDDGYVGSHVENALRRIDCESYIILIADRAAIDTFVHELGHAYGLSHRMNAHNVMKSGIRDPDAEFTKRQVERIKRGIIMRKITCD